MRFDSVSGERSFMARNDGIHRTSARNARLTTAKIGSLQQHNEREKASYVNQDIVLERTQMNVHFKIPADDYMKLFDQMVEEGTISTRGLKADAEKFGELIFDVNSATSIIMAVMNSPSSFMRMPTRLQLISWAVSIYLICCHARRRAQPRNVRSVGTGRVSLSSSCGIYSSGRKADSMVKAMQR